MSGITRSQEIFKRDSTGGIRVWMYEVQGDSWRTISGIQGGSLVTSKWTVCTPKSKKTAEEQAAFEAAAELKKKLDRDYRPTLAEIDRPRASVVKPMLAYKYEGYPDDITQAFSQPKLDGIRCIATKDGLWSRQGKPILGCPHIMEALAPVFAWRPSSIFDGELYNHELKDDFNQITSLVKKQKPNEAELAQSAQLIQYHIYDMPSCDDSFAVRHLLIAATIGGGLNTIGPWPSCLVEVPTRWVENAEQVDAHYAELLEAGYEGQIVRINGPYEQKRSKLLLKRKEFLDAEFPVVRVEEGQGNWAGFAKRAVLTLPDGREFGAGIKGDQAHAKELLGKTFKSATVRYFTPTPDGIPRFPVAVSFHEGERL